MFIGEIASEKNQTYIAHAWVKATSPTAPSSVTITLGRSTGQEPRVVGSSYILTDVWQRVAVYLRRPDADSITLSMGITRDVGAEQQSSFMVKDPAVTLFGVQSPLN